MPRPLRIHYPHAWYHVMNRGASQKNIFKNNLHRNLFLELLKEANTMFNIHIHAYCLMDNHYHLLLSTPDANLSRAMRHINGVYTQRFNRINKKDGSLFKGRYIAKLIADDDYQLQVSRYIHLNPVTANIVKNPADFRWSSYRAYLGIDKKPSWLSINTILEQITPGSLLAGIKNYRDYVENYELDDINFFFSQKYASPIVGSPMFKEKILSQIDPTISRACLADVNRAKILFSSESIIAHVCRFYNISRESLTQARRHVLNLPRLVCIYLCRKRFGLTLQSIASSFNISHITVSSSVQKCEDRMQVLPALRQEVDEIYKIIREEVLKSD